MMKKWRFLNLLELYLNGILMIQESFRIDPTQILPNSLVEPRVINPVNDLFRGKFDTLTKAKS